METSGIRRAGFVNCRSSTCQKIVMKTRARALEGMVACDQLKKKPINPLSEKQTA